MFLDDKLIQMCEQAEINEPADVQTLYNELLAECQNFYKERVKVGMRKTDVKGMIVMTFHAFDSFVRMAKKHDSFQVRAIGDVCEKYPWKMVFEKNEKLKEFFDSL